MVGNRPTLPVPTDAAILCASCRPFGTGLCGVDVIIPESGDWLFFFGFFVAFSADVRTVAGAGVGVGVGADVSFFRGRPRFFFTGAVSCAAFAVLDVCAGAAVVVIVVGGGDFAIFEPSICVFATKSRSSDDV